MHQQMHRLQISNICIDTAWKTETLPCIILCSAWQNQGSFQSTVQSHICIFKHSELLHLARKQASDVHTRLKLGEI